MSIARDHPRFHCHISLPRKHLNKMRLLEKLCFAAFNSFIELKKKKKARTYQDS